MPIRLGSGDINKVYLGSTEVSKVYLGSEQVYPATPAVNNAFELTVETTESNETFLLPMQSVTSIDIDWGDGTVEAGITTDNPTHVYATADTYAISVTGTAGTVVFSNSGSQNKLRSVTNLGALSWTSLSYSFRACSSMTSFDAGDCDTSNATSMYGMFDICTSLASLDLSNFDTSSVTDMYAMFQSCSSLASLDLSNFDTSSVTDMSNMFYLCSSLENLDLSNFDTSSVRDMGWMFRDCNSLATLDLSNFDTSSVTTDMSFMFSDCSSLSTLDVSSFDTSSVTSMRWMFRDCTSLTDIVGVEDFNIEGLNSTGSLDNFATNVTLPTPRYDALLINWDAQEPLNNITVNFGSSQYTAGGAAEAARTSLSDGDNWNIIDGGPVPVNNAFELTVATTSSNETFLLPMQSVTSIDVDWGDGNVETGITTDNPTHVYTTAGTHAISVTGTAGTVVFRNSGSEGKLRTVTNLGALGWTTFADSFRLCSSMTSFDAGDCNTSSVTSMEATFRGCSSLTSLDVSSFNTSSVTNMGFMFRFCLSLTSLDASGFDTSSVSRMDNMFYNCPSLTSLDVSSFDTSSVTNMSYMFFDCSSLTSLDVSSFNTSSVTNMSNIFNGCSSLTTLGASSFDTSSVTRMDSMFFNCSSLTSLDVSSFNTSSVTNMGFMFLGCSSLTSLDVSSFNTSSVTNMSYMFNGCSSLTTLDLSNFDTSSATDMREMFSGCSSLTDIVGVESFNIEGLNLLSSLTNFATNVTLPTARYDTLLVNWDAQEPFNNMSPDFGSSKYTAGGAAEAARTSLRDGDGWNITDGGSV